MYKLILLKYLVEFYKQRGHDFLALTDHQVFTDFGGLAGDKFLIIPGIEIAVKHERLPKAEIASGKPPGRTRFFTIRIFGNAAMMRI